MTQQLSSDKSALFDYLVCGIIAVDQSGVVRSVNDTTERLLRKPRRHLLNTPITAVLPGHPIAIELLERAQTLAAPCYCRRVQLHPMPDLQITVNLSAIPLLTGERIAQGALLQIEEMANAEQLEEEDRLHTTLDSLGNLALAVAHEIKNPLAGIRGATQLLDREISTPGPGDRDRDDNGNDRRSTDVSPYTNLILSETDRISRLLDKLLGLADTPACASSTINIHEVLNHVVLLISKASEHIHIQRDYDPSLPSVRGDRDPLVQVFLNLIKNAVEAHHEVNDRALRIRIHTRIARQIRSVYGRRNLSVMVAVSDNGPGIPPDLGDRIFMPFVTTKSHGSGIGLSITRKIVHDHDGVMAWESRPGKTVFRVFLPAQESHREIPGSER